MRMLIYSAAIAGEPRGHISRDFSPIRHLRCTKSAGDGNALVCAAPDAVSLDNRPAARDADSRRGANHT